jgi:hypothetical protein
LIIAKEFRRLYNSPVDVGRSRDEVAERTSYTNRIHMEQDRHRTFVYSALLVAAFSIAFFFFAYPLYVIRPFRRQGPRELALALQVIQVRPLVEILCAAAALVALLLYWPRTPRRRRRIFAAAGALLACAFAALSRVNVYELMFHPDSKPVFVSAQQAKIDLDDTVLAVKLGGSARAYPIRSIAYHHIINDTVGGEPIVATY